MTNESRTIQSDPELEAAREALRPVNLHGCPVDEAILELLARLNKAELERDEEHRWFNWVWDRWGCTIKARHEAESLVALAMREGLAAVEAERGGRRTAVRAWLRASRSAVEYAELLRLALKIGLEQCEAERSRADRLEAACAAMRERLDFEVVLEGASRQWYCDTCDNARLLADGRVAGWFASREAVTHIPGCPLHPDAGARLLARLEAAERVAEAAGVYQADGTLASATAIYEALAAWRAENYDAYRYRFGAEQAKAEIDRGRRARRVLTQIDAALAAPDEDPADAWQRGYDAALRDAAETLEAGNFDTLARRIRAMLPAPYEPPAPDHEETPR